MILFFSQATQLKDETFRPRKRTRNPHNHKETKRKKLVQHGDEHVSKSGSIIKRKKFHAQETCKCKRNCSRKIDVVRQKQIFQEFYQFKNWSEKHIFLWSLMKSVEPKKKIIPIIPLTKKKSVHSYYLTDADGIAHQVCLHFLRNCLQISKSTMDRAAAAIVSNPNAIDRRGGFHFRIAHTSDISFLKSFISQYPCHESHYRPSKSNSSAKFLKPSLNIITMYREYSLLCRAKNKKVLNVSMFRYVFNTQFNLRFARLKIDTCNTCDRLDTLLKCFDAGEHEKWEKEKDQHLKMVLKYELQFDETIKNAEMSNASIEVFTFDLQRALEMPRLTTNVAYYKRKLWLYNLCIYDEIRHIGYMYVWPESIASRGAQEIAACLCRHFRERLPSNTKKIVLKSDSCYGQNKNIKLALILKKFIDSWPYPDLISIEQRYFVVGHSYNSCDRCFATIEKQKKRTEDIFVPSQWMNVMRQAKKKNPKFIVSEMRKEDFVSSKPLEKLIVNRKKSITGDRISWNRFQNIIYDRNSPFILKVKEYNPNESPIIEISLQRNRVSKKIGEIKLPLLYPNGRPIDKQKYDDLKELMKYVPKHHHSFFNALKYVNNEKK